MKRRQSALYSGAANTPLNSNSLPRLRKAQFAASCATRVEESTLNSHWCLKAKRSALLRHLMLRLRRELSSIQSEHTSVEKRQAYHATAQTLRMLPTSFLRVVIQQDLL